MLTRQDYFSELAFEESWLYIYVCVSVCTLFSQSWLLRMSDTCIHIYIHICLCVDETRMSTQNVGYIIFRKRASYFEALSWKMTYTSRHPTSTQNVGYMYTYIYIHLCIYLEICVYIWRYMYIFTYVYTWMYIYVCVSVYTLSSQSWLGWIHIYIHIYMHFCRYMEIIVYIWRFMYVFIYVYI